MRQPTARPQGELFTTDAEVVDEPGHGPIRMDCDVEILVYEEVIPWSLADDAEVIHEGGLGSHLAVELAFGYSCSLVLIPGRQARAAHALWLEVKQGMETAAVIKRSSEQHVEVSTQGDIFPYPSICTGYGYSDIDSDLDVRCYGGLRCRCEHQAEQGYEQWQCDESQSPYATNADVLDFHFLPSPQLCW